MKISYKVPLIATSIIVLAFAGYSVLQYKLIKESLYEQTEGSIAEISTALDGEISNWLNDRLSVMQSMSEIISADFSVEKLRQLFSTPELNEKVSYFFAGLNTDGKVINDYEEKFDPSPDWDARKRPWSAVARRHNKAIMTAPYPDFIDKRLLITVASQLYDKGIPIGTMGADLELKAISDALNSVTFNQTGYAFLVDETGKMITHPDKKYHDKPLSSLFTNTVPVLAKKLQQSMIGDESVLAAFYPLTGFKGSETKWLIGVVVDENKVLAPANRLGRNAIIGSVIVAILSSLIFFFFMRTALIKPVNRLTEQADEISRGSLTTEIEGVERNDEIGDLAKAVQRLQKSLRMAMDRIRKTR